MNCFAKWTSNVVGVRVPPDNIRFREGFHREKVWIVRRGGDGVEKILGNGWTSDVVEVLAGRGNEIQVDMCSCKLGCIANKQWHQ